MTTRSHDIPSWHIRRFVPNARTIRLHLGHTPMLQPPGVDELARELRAALRLTGWTVDMIDREVVHGRHRCLGLAVTRPKPRMSSSAKSSISILGVSDLEPGARGMPVGDRWFVASNQIRISVSHTEGAVLVALGILCRLGVDVETVRDRGLRRLRHHALTGPELDELERHDSASPQRALSRLLDPEGGAPQSRRHRPGSRAETYRTGPPPAARRIRSPFQRGSDTRGNGGSSSSPSPGASAAVAVDGP